MLERCIPDSDDGETLTLAVESPVIGFALLAFARAEVEAVLGQRIAARVRFWVNPALTAVIAMRKAFAGAEQTAAAP